MMNPKIRFVVETISSKVDTNGNRYHAARITSTITAKSIFITDVSGPRGARWLVSDATDPLGDTCYTIEREIPKRQWKRLSCNPALREGQVTPGMIRALEVPNA